MNDRYRKISVRMHADEKYLALSAPQPNGRSLWEWLLHGPMTGPIPGVIRAGVAAMAEELDWDQEGFDKAFREIIDLGMAEYDPKNRIVWLPNAIKHNKPASPNVVVSWAQEWGLVKECELKAQIYERLRLFVCGLDKDGKTAFSDAFDKSIAKPFSKPSGKPSVKAIPKQEQEQEQEQEQDKKTSGKPKSVGLSSSDLNDVFQHWCDVHGHSKARLDDKRRKLIRSAYALGYSVGDMKSAINGCKKSAFHQGDNKGKRVYDSLELILRSAEKIDTFMKIDSDSGRGPGGGIGGAASKTASAMNDLLNGAH